MILFETKNYNSQLVEDYMSRTESRLKKDLLNLLRNQGYNRYAKRLETLNINIIYPNSPLANSITTAAISFDDMLIYVNTNFLDMDYYKKQGKFLGSNHFEQMSVIIRHELCHNLLMHQIRMVNKLKDIIPEKKLRMSRSLHEILNILEDFEISNLRYSEADKNIVRNTYLNGEIISGLVTEDHRRDWADKSLEDMYEALLAELDEIYRNFSNARPYNTPDGPFGVLWRDSQTRQSSNPFNGVLTRASVKAHSYKNPQAYANVYDMDELARTIAQIKSMNAEVGSDFEEIANAFNTAIIDDPDNGYNIKDIDNMIDQIKKSKVSEKIVVKSPVTNKDIVELNIPEEKQFAIEVLNIIADRTPYKKDFETWKKQIEDKISPDEFSEDEIKELIDILEKNKSN